MTELLTAVQMRAVEQAAIESGIVTGLELMEQAGRGVVEAVLAEWPALATGVRHAVVLCGPGNNGGDGFVVARRLLDRGWRVEVLFHGNAGRLPADARRCHDVWAAMGAVAALTPEAAGQGDRPDLLVDALFGTGCTRAIPLDCAVAFHAVRKREGRARCRVVAVDCPSGLDCDSGRILLPEPPAEAEDEALWTWWQTDASQRLLLPDLTATFHRRKPGHVLEGGPTGTVTVVDIGLGAEDTHPAHLAVAGSTGIARLLDFDRPEGRSRRIWPGNIVDKAQGAGRHKFDHGHALVLSGGAGRTGAARLAARGALRIGAGLVSLGVPGSAQLEAAAQVTAIMLARIDDGPSLFAALEDDRITALCLGPGLGRDRAHALVPVACAAGRAMVLDADALSAYGDEPRALFDLIGEDCVLTPHGGEFARLFPDLAERLAGHPTRGPAFSRIDAARAAAERAGCVVLLKGPDTVIGAPDGRCSVNAAIGRRATPWLATAGAGDVLAGFITGLLARGVGPFEAAETAAWLHVECARAFGPGLIAEDLPEVLPQVLAELGT